MERKCWVVVRKRERRIVSVVKVAVVRLQVDRRQMVVVHVVVDALVVWVSVVVVYVSVVAVVSVHVRVVVVVAFVHDQSDLCPCPYCRVQLRSQMVVCATWIFRWPWGTWCLMWGWHSSCVKFFWSYSS